MALLSDLPNETIHEILEFVQPEDLENFAQITRHVYLVAKPFLEEHRRLIRKYGLLRRAVSATEKRHATLYGTIPEVLLDVWNNPRVGHYIKRIQLGRWGSPFGTGQGFLDASEEEQMAYLSVRARQLAEFEKAAICAKYLVSLDSEGCENWGQLLDSEYATEEFLLTLLLLLLPNLTYLSLEPLYCEDPFPSTLLADVSIGKAPIFFKLKTIHIEPQFVNGVEECSWLEDLGAFATLPHLENLSARRTKYNGTVPPTSHVTSLCLLDCFVSSKPLHEYLLRFKDLSTFVLKCRHPEDFMERGLYEFDPFIVRSALVVHARTSLQHLTILPVPERTGPIGSMKVFTDLRELFTDWRLLFPDLETFELSENLPTSLIQLRLRDEDGLDKSAYVCLFEDIIAAKTTTHPCLQSLEIVNASQQMVSSSSAVSHWMQECENVGLSLRVSAQQ